MGSSSLATELRPSTGPGMELPIGYRLRGVGAAYGLADWSRAGEVISLPPPSCLDDPEYFFSIDGLSFSFIFIVDLPFLPVGVMFVVEYGVPSCGITSSVLHE